MDVDLLSEAQRSHHLVHLDREVQKIASNLSLLSNHNAPAVDAPSGGKKEGLAGRSCVSEVGSSGAVPASAPSAEDDTVTTAKQEAPACDVEEDFEALVLGQETAVAQEEEEEEDEIDLT